MISRLFIHAPPGILYPSFWNYSRGKGRFNFILPGGEPFVILNNGAGSFGGNPRGRQEESSLYSWLGLGIAK
jgi:hypothetical protein